MEIQNNSKYDNVKKAITKEEKTVMNYDDLEKMMALERMEMDYSSYV
jgi:hypothetical protein